MVSRAVQFRFTLSFNNYFITDQIKHKNIRLTYCPTEAMISDFFTKPLQVLQDMGEGRNKSNDNPAGSAEEAKTSSGACKRIHTTGTSIDGTNDIIQDGVSNTQNQHRLINAN